MINLKKLRTTLAAIVFVLISLLFLDFTGTIHSFLGWLAKIQFMPALFALHFAVVIVMVGLTLLFGRLYCSVICPLGIFQDVVSQVASKKKKNRFRYSKAISWLRFAVLGLFILMFFCGIGSVVALLEPYSIFGRIASNLFAPFWQWGNNLLAYFAERADSYAFYTTEVWIKSMPTFIIALGSFIIIIVLAWRGGRTYCNTICPVGTILGYISKFSFYKITFDKEKCNSCGLCAMNCKSSCIDAKAKEVDYSRCVSCFNCLEKCKRDAIHFTRRVKEDGMVTKKENNTPSTDNGRKQFIATTAVMVGATITNAQKLKVDGGLSVIVDKKIPKRDNFISPPGSDSHRNFTTKCTGCQLCVTVCPNQVLRPSTKLERFMQPELSFEKGYCRPECTKCSEVCPAGAINKIAREDKTAISVGTAHWIEKNCVVLTDDVPCGNCARHCPSGAIKMIAKECRDGKTHRVPVVNLELCIGCGACEYVCPAAPFSAIYVEGSSYHRNI